MATEFKRKDKKTIEKDSQRELKEIKGDKEGFRKWVEDLYVNLLTDEDLKVSYEAFKFIGFNRDEVMEQIYQTFKEIHIVSEVVVAIALRGPVAANNLRLSNGRSISSYGIAPNGGRRNKLLTGNKIQAATADLAAFYLKKLNIPKRISSLLCPSWLQFPSAGSLPLDGILRQQHLEFAIQFSKLITQGPNTVGNAVGGFNQQIYDQMVNNTYCDDRLRPYLFG